MSTHKKIPKIGVGNDLGTAFLAISVYELGKCRPIESAIDGTQIPTIVYVDGDKTHVGTEAIMRSFNHTGDDLFLHAKRNFFERAREKIYGGRFTPVEVFTMILEYARKVLLSGRPDLADYPQFGGQKRSADDLALVFTCPANWGVEQHSNYEDAIKAAGFFEFDGFVAEPIAAARRVAHLASVELRDSDKILVVDVGAGTTDIAVLEYRQGVFHQIAAASGDAYLAGHDFTNAISQHFANHFRISWKDVYDKGGLNLTKVSPKQRPQVVACWNAAEEAKKKLSILPDVTVPVELPKGRKTVGITQDEASRLWQDLFSKFKDCVSAALKGTDLSFSDITHAMLVGGSSRVPGLREAMAKVMGRDVSDILVCTDSEHIVSGGAAEHAFFQDEHSQALENGLGFVVYDQAANLHRNLLMVPPGQVIPPDGFFMHRDDFAISTDQGRRTLVCKPFVCKTGVRAVVIDGRETFLQPSETIPLDPVSASVETFPEGDHAISLGIKADPNRKLWLLARPLNLNVEPLSIPLRMATPGGNSGLDESLTSYEILLLLDVSGSMRGQKLRMLQDGAKKFASFAIGRGAEIGVVIFPDPASTKPPEGAKLLLRPSSDNAQVCSAIDSLNAGAGTPLGNALQVAATAFSKRNSEQTAVLFTDGHPNDPDAAILAANHLKTLARLITVGIGEDVHAIYLKGLASDSSDYFYARCPESILDAFANVAQLIWTKGHLPPTQAEETFADGDVDIDSDYETDWEQIQTEEVA